MQEPDPNDKPDPSEETITEGGTNALAPAKPKSQLVVQEGGVLPILPRNIEEAMRYSSGLISANIVPDAFKVNGQADPHLILMGVLKSMELGVPPQTGLAGLLPLNGRFGVWGDLAAALVQRHGLVTNQTTAWVGPAFDENLPLGEWPLDFGCEVRYWRKGQDQPYIGRFTVRDAKRAGLWMHPKKKPWNEYPKRMLYNRARAYALRDGFADGLAGLSIAEEMIDQMPEVPEEERRTSNLSALTADDELTNNGASNEEPNNPDPEADRPV